ncbi:MAG: hypothetical protein ABSC01_05420, partial [Verrucomicrobiota bacterium]
MQFFTDRFFQCFQRGPDRVADPILDQAADGFHRAKVLQQEKTGRPRLAGLIPKLKETVNLHRPLPEESPHFIHAEWQQKQKAKTYSTWLRNHHQLVLSRRTIGAI